MKCFLLLLFIFIYFTIKTDSGDDKNKPHNPVNTYITLVNDTSQNFYVEKKRSKIPCDTCSGEKLVECFFSLLIADQHKVFQQLPPHKRREILRKFKFKEYEEFLESYNEPQWKELFDTLTKDEQEYWPKTVKEQIEALEHIKQQAGVVSDVFNTVGDLALAVAVPPVFLGLACYKIYHIVRYDENPLKANFIKTEFNQYMKARFEIIKDI